MKEIFKSFRLGFSPRIANLPLKGNVRRTVISHTRKQWQIIVLGVAVALAGRCVGTARAQTSKINQPTPTQEQGQTNGVSKNNVKSITGRISSLDTTQGTFTVRSATGEVIHLKGSKNASPASVRRGERVIVTYEDGVALSLQATRRNK